MIANKTDFFNDLSNQISSPIYLTDKTDEVNEEIKNNHWVLRTPPEIIAQTTTPDFLEFIQKVKDDYANQLNKSNLEIHLIFYLWCEEPGELCFNFINSNHDKLPFRCELKFTDKPEEIVEQYLKSKYHDGIIPWDEFETVGTAEEMAEASNLEKELHDNYVLTVYQEIIKKKTPP